MNPLEFEEWVEGLYQVGVQENPRDSGKHRECEGIKSEPYIEIAKKSLLEGAEDQGWIAINKCY